LPDPGTTGIRTYADYARRSPIPDRGDGRTHTPRNSPALVNASITRDENFYLHFDGEFPSAEDLVEGTFTGRNFGWLPGERADAVAHIARVIREDDGSDALAVGCYGLSYTTILAGTAPGIPAACRLPEALRVDATTATDAGVLHAVAAIVSAYMRGLVYQQDAAGRYIGSPFDRFLILNGLPRRPDTGETPADYARRLRAALAALPAPKLLDNPDVLAFEHHDQVFAFGADELAGLRIFLAEPAGAAASADEIAAGGIGNCVACHPPPHFSDFGFHNNGVAQAEYDGIHGAGAFAALAIPGLGARQAAPESFLPASGMYPGGTGPFLAAPSADHPGRVDLGVWNVLANDALPAPQPTLVATLGRLTGATTAAELLPLSVARFKTAGLRDLGQSAPYFHNGGAAALEDAVRHYVTTSAAARAATVRNGDGQLARIAIGEAEVAALAAFLRALNEDYD